MQRKLEMSTRSIFLLRDFKKKGEEEYLHLPENCRLEFPDALPNNDNGAQKYKRFIIHISPDYGLYKDGHFQIEFNVRDVPEYPFQPPKVRMLTKIWHPNVHPDGTINVRVTKIDSEMIENGYNPMLGVQGVVHGVLGIFDGVMNENDPDNFQEALQQYQRNRQEFIEKVRQWITLYAQNPAVIEEHKAPQLTDSAEYQN